MIKSIYIQNFRIFRSFHLPLNNDLNIVVGNNEEGKSTVLEAIALALTKRIGGKLIESELSSHLFNRDCAESYRSDLARGANPELPKIIIELYLADSPQLAFLRGSNNTQREDTVGVKLEIVFDEDYREEYAALRNDGGTHKTIPAEYYKVQWYSFSNNAVTPRSLPLTVFHIDATTIRLQSGTDYYIQNLIGDGLSAKERVALAVAYRKLKEQFAEEPSIKSINTALTKGAISDKALSIGMDTSRKSTWETNLVPHLDDLPFQFIGKGEQTALKIILALDRSAKDSNIVLIEEPENHLSFSSMSRLIAEIAKKCTGKQIVMATHSAYVLNKLGIEKVLLLHSNRTTSLAKLPPDTYNYFKKLSGYDTLRLILAKKAILVEGPSDELIVQRAYKEKHGMLPIEDGIDVINVRGLSFSRFLDIAKELDKEVVVVTDNDGDHRKNVVEKYAAYATFPTIKICSDADDSARTLEPQIVKCNELALLNRILKTSKPDKTSLAAHMEANKTECALALFETAEAFEVPDYIQNAVA